MKNISYQIVNKTKFSNFLRKFTTISSNLLLEIDHETNVIAKTFDTDRTILKMGKDDFEDIGLKNLDPTIKLDKRIHIGIFNLDRFIKIISLMSDNIKLDLNYVESKKKDFIEIDKIILSDNIIDFAVDCAEKMLFTYLSDEKFEEIVNTDENQLNFTFDLEQRRKMLEVGGLDDDGIVTISYKKKKFTFSGSGWKYAMTLSDLEANVDDFSVKINKTNLRYLDPEDYTTFLLEDKCIFVSKETDFKIIISIVEDVA